MNFFETPNEIHDNIFTDQEIEDIYNAIENSNTDNTNLIPIYRQRAYFCNMPQNIRDRVTGLATSIFNQRVRLTEISFANYSKQSGMEDPILSPHFDNTFEEPRLTLDVQLLSNFTWPIVVEGKSISLKNNQATTFSGTHQIHWREYREFKDTDSIDMLFCHFSIEEDSVTKISMKEKMETESRSIFWINKFYQDIMKELKK